MARAKIIFLPTGVSQYLNVTDRYDKWTYNTNNIKSDGYIMTDTKSSIEEVNNTFWFKLAADSGYKITRMYRTNSRGTANTYEYTPNDYIYPWASGTATIINNYLYVEIEPDAIKYNLIQNLENCTSNISGNTIGETEDKEIILTCNDGFAFEEVPTITIGDNIFEFNLNDDLTIATIRVNIVGDVIINAVARINKRVYITGNLINATCNYSDGEF